MHKRSDGTIFYVGKGINTRAFTSHDRTNLWKEAAKDGWYPEIVKSDLSEKEALILEESLIEFYKDCCINRVKTGVVKSVVKEMFSEYIAYDHKSPSGLVWIKERLRGRGSEVFKIGDVAGTLDRTNTKRGWRVKFNGRMYYAHRIVWCLFHNITDEALIIDHLDGNPWNNNIKNLQPKSKADNNRNSVRQEKLKGALRKVDPKTGKVYYMAYWKNLNGKVETKSFSIEKYGEDTAMQMAREYRVVQLELLREQGAKYTDRHIYQ